jgi:RNA polymerase sigma-70 factor (ECF subfamily)
MPRVFMAARLPDGGELTFRLSLTDSADPSGGNPRHPLEDKTLALFDELRTPLLRYVLSLRISPARGEEIIQEAFLRLFEHLKAGKSESNLRGWLFRVAHNLAVRDLRGQSTQAISTDSVFTLLAESSEDPSPNPEQQLILDERESRLLAALSRLTDGERQCLSLRAEGLRYREIASVLNIGVTTVADSLRRAIDTLQKELRG